jgi:hypothetical protein
MGLEAKQTEKRTTDRTLETEKQRSREVGNSWKTLETRSQSKEQWGHGTAVKTRKWDSIRSWPTYPGD